RGLLDGRSRVVSKGSSGQAIHFDAGAGATPDSLTWHWRLDLETTVKGGSHGPAHGSPSGASARIVRDNEVWSATSHRRLRTSDAGGAAHVPTSTAQEGSAARGQDDNSKDAKRRQMSRGTVAFYARVSSDAQAREHTIDSQISALRERIAAHDHTLNPRHG